MRLEVHDVIGQRVGRAVVVLLAAADKDDRKARLRIRFQHFIDPARHPAAHKRKGAFQQQADIGIGGAPHQGLFHDDQ
jgi:hypothetical protein